MARLQPASWSVSLLKDGTLIETPNTQCCAACVALNLHLCRTMVVGSVHKKRSPAGDYLCNPKQVTD